MLTFDDSLPMMLHRALDGVMPVYRELFARYDLTDQQWRILRVLWASGKVTSVELSERTLLAPPSLVGIVDRLEKKGLVARVRSVEDRRVVHVTATDKGKALEKQVMPQVAKIHARIRGSVSQREWDALARTLNKISEDMKTAELKEAANI